LSCHRELSNNHQETLSHMLQDGQLKGQFLDLLPDVASDFGLPPPRSDDEIKV
jgi:hypothetical protein